MNGYYGTCMSYLGAASVRAFLSGIDHLIQACPVTSRLWGMNKEREGGQDILPMILGGEKQPSIQQEPEDSMTAEAKSSILSWK